MNLPAASSVASSWYKLDVQSAPYSPLARTVPVIVVFSWVINTWFPSASVNVKIIFCHSPNENVALYKPSSNVNEPAEEPPHAKPSEDSGWVIVKSIAATFFPSSTANTWVSLNNPSATPS